MIRAAAEDDGSGAADRAGRRFPAAHSGPRDGAGGAGAAHAVRQARANYASHATYTEVHGPHTLVDSSRIDRVQVGDVHHHHHGRRTAAPLLSGAVPAGELRRLREVFVPPPDYAELLDLLREHRVLALCGDPGSGRATAALALLDEVAGGAVRRMDPRTDLDVLAGSPVAADEVEAGHGYLLELPGGGPAADEPRLARIGALLAGRDGHLVLVADAGEPADALLRGRYGRLLLPPPAERVLERHLAALLPGPDAAGTRADALRTAARADLRAALGLAEPRPPEAVELAGLLARHATGELGDAALLAACGLFAPRQAAAWFAGAGGGSTPRAAAFRIALAVYDGAPYSVAAEAAETLAWELATTLDPERPPGRPLFTDRPRARLAAARAELGDGEVALGDDRLRVRTVRFQGRGLPWAVLSHVWEQHHNARGPMCRWLGAQCDDPRPLAWVPAALAAGALAVLDFPYAESELLTPLAASDSGTQRLAVATALAQAARAPEVRPVVASLVADWAQDEHPLLRSTAALAHGYGTVAGSVSRSLDALGPLSGPAPQGERAAAGAAADDWAQLQDVSFSVARLAAGGEPGEVLRRIALWLADRRAGRRDLALLCVVQLTGSRSWQLWGLDDQPGLDPYPNWPLVAALLAGHPEQTPLLADLVWAGLDAARAREAVLSGLTAWMRRAEGDARLLDALCGFLPRLAHAPREAAWLRSALRGLARDPDLPVTSATARRIAQVLGAALDEALDEAPGEAPGGTPADPPP